MALYTGSPVALSQTMVVSRWLVMPMAAMSAADAPTLPMASAATPNWVAQISLASCSTQPGLGKIWVNSFWALLQMRPCLSKRMQRLLVVPASNAMMYLAMGYLRILLPSEDNSVVTGRPWAGSELRPP